MYCDWKTLNEILKCSICGAKLADVVKLVPECGHSVCGECEEAMRRRAAETADRRFECSACGGSHAMPPTGLDENKTVLMMLALQPKEKPLSESALALKATTEELAERLKCLRMQDDREEINFYCDSLELEVIETLKSAVAHLNRLQEEFLTEINEYRTRLLARRRPEDAPESAAKQELAVLAAELEAFNREWAEFFTQMSKVASDEEIGRAQTRLRDLESRLERTRTKLNGELFAGRFLAFKENDLFCTSNKHLGVLAYSYSPEAESPEQMIELKLQSTLLGHLGFVHQVLFLPNGQLASCSSDRSVKVWSVEQPPSMLYELNSQNHAILSLALLPNGALASGSWSGGINIWDLNERMLVRTLEGHTGPVFSLKVLQSGQLASCSYDDTIKVWNAASSAAESSLLLTMTGHGINCFTGLFGLLSNGNLVTCSCTFSVNEVSVFKIWNPTKGKLVKSLSTSSKHVRSLAVLADDSLVAGFIDGTIRIFDLDKSASRTLPERHEGAVLSLVQLPNGYLLSGGSKKEPTLKVWDPLGLRLITTIRSQHDGDIASLDISGDGKLVASGSEDKAIKIWSLSF